MEQAIIALVSVSLTLTIYLDRTRRVDMAAGFARLDGRINDVRTEMNGRIDDLRTEMTAGFAAQTTALVDLAQSVGRVEGRTETLVAAE